MPSANLKFEVDGDGCWPDLAGKKIHNVTDAMSIAGLSNGMGSGAPSVSIRFDLEDGSVVIGQTSLKLFLTTADALKARFGDPRS
jgi:hypothetical protein